MRDVLGRLRGLLAAEFLGLKRDKTAMFFILVLPVVVVFVIGLAFGGGGDRKAPAGIVLRDHSAEARALVRSVRHGDQLAVTDYASVGKLRDAVLRGGVQLGVVVPAGYGADLRAGRAVTLTVISTSGGGGTGLAQSSVGADAGTQLVVEHAARVAAEATGAPAARARRVAAAVARRARTATVTSTTVKGRPFSGGLNRAAYTMLVFFVFMTALTSAGTIVELRASGVARRLLASPARRGEISVGIVGGRFVTILVSAVYLVLVTRFLFDVRWGDLAAVGLVVVVTCVCASAVVTVFGSLLRTPEQSGAIGPPVGIALGMLGGAMWPLEIVPRFMQVAGHLLPTAWAVDAFTKIVDEGAGVSGVLGDVGVLLAMSVLLFVIGGLRLRRTFATP